MSILVCGGPRRGKTTLAKLLAGTHGLQHMCTDPQRYCFGFMGTPDRLGYDEVSGWVAQNWLPLPGVVIDGVHALRALQKYMDGSAHAQPVERVIMQTHEFEQRLRPGQRAQATKVDSQLAELMPTIGRLVEFWEPDGKGGFRELPRCSLVQHTPAPAKKSYKAARKVSRRA